MSNALANPNYRIAFNTLALDAAAVAGVWYVALAHALGLPLSMSSISVLAMSVWLVYIGDRWLDVWGKTPESLPTQRHQILARWRWQFLTIWWIVLLIDVAVAVVGLTAQQLLAGLIVLACSVIYTIGIQRRAQVRRTKELQVALIFIVGVGAFFVGEPMSTHARAWLYVLLSLFGLACWVNCVLLARWEMGVDRQLGRQSLPLALGEHAKHLTKWALATGVVGLGLALIAPRRMAGIPLLLGLYGFYLLTLDATEWPRNIELRRSFADGGLVIFGLAACLF